MANKTKVLETLEQYFKTKGRVLKSQEYARESDAPTRIQQVKNIFGGWNRLEKLLMAREANGVDAITDIDAVLKARNDALLEASKQWKEASENQDKKARREAEAQHIAEVLAANAATPEGANANKIAIGGPLPSEQPNFDVMGATVETDPVTKEQTVVNVDPILPDSENPDPRTPTELRDAVARDGLGGGSVDTGSATDGGSTGEASISTANALGGDTADADQVADKSKVAQTSTESSKNTPVKEIEGK